MRGLRNVALSGRAVCCTIHQPSIPIFNGFDRLLLLKRGGQTVFFGDLGDESSELIKYLESYPSTPKIKPGENPATWMLTTIGAGSAGSGDGDSLDYAASFARSSLKQATLEKIAAIKAECDETLLISFSSEYATDIRTQMWAVLKRMMTIYWRSPSYNVTRTMVSAIVALLFGSIYASQRTPETEGDMNSRITCIFIACLFLGVNAFNSVLGVFETERNMYYRHRAALMYNERAIALAFTVAEIPFIFSATMAFVVGFYFLTGFALALAPFFLFFLFFALNIGIWTFLGQMFMSIFKDSETAQGFGGLIIGMTAMFSGILIRPQNVYGFWQFAYWAFPGHYIIEGIIASQFKNDETPIQASLGSPFFVFVSQSDPGCLVPGNPCIGTAEEWVEASFGGKFDSSHIGANIIYLVSFFVVARFITYLALKKFNHLAK